VLHIASGRFDERTEAVTEVKVYSNASQVSLEVNGVSLGVQSDPAGDRIFRWPGVRLSPGGNRVSASAHFDAAAVADSCVWTLATR
jgi:beta-galactosidase